MNKYHIIGGIAFSAIMFLIALLDLELQSGSDYQDLSILGKIASWLFCAPLVIWVGGLLIGKINKLIK